MIEQTNEQHIINNLEEELSLFFSGLFEKYNYKVSEELNNNIPLEIEFNKILNDIEIHLNNIFKENVVLK